MTTKYSPGDEITYRFFSTPPREGIILRVFETKMEIVLNGLRPFMTGISNPKIKLIVKKTLDEEYASSF